jgi:pyruvate-formate lyase-activating enzyme
MFVRPRVLSILTTRRCTAACDHCCVGASPKATAKIPVPRIHGLIDEAKRIASMERVVFTGGECFLLGADLDAVVRHASANGFATRVVTNGYWAVNERAAGERVQALRTSGLDEMMLSTGTFHQRFVPVERIICAARAAAAAGIATRISVEACDQQTFDDTILREALAGLIAARRVHVSLDPWIADAGGRGAAALTHDRPRGDGAGARGRCAQIMTVIAVTPEQQLIACCGFPLEELPRLSIGSVAERALDDVLAASPDELLKMWLHVEGPAGIAAFVARHLPGFALPPAASICDACIALQRHPGAMRVVSRHAPAIAEQIAAEYARLQGAFQPIS